MIFNKNTKVMVHLSNRDSHFPDIVAGVLQSDIVASYIYIYCALMTYLEYQ